MEVDKLLIFDLVGKLAHFRKFYTNSSSLTYTFPPRTTLTGIIAGMIGRERDSYYNEFSTRNCKIAVSIISPLRKSVHTVNYLFVKNPRELNGYAKHTQIPIEILFPKEEEIRYRIFFYHPNNAIMDQLLHILQKNSPVFPPYLGISEFTARAEFIQLTKDVSLEKTDKIKIKSVVNMDSVKENGLIITPSSKNLQYITELMPLEFDSERRVINKAVFAYEKEQNPLNVRLKKPFYVVRYNGTEENILFME